MRYLFAYSCALLLLPVAAVAQTLRGTVRDAQQQPLSGASVYWLATTSGTATDAAGAFMLTRHPSTDRLVVSFVGYRADTLTITDQPEVAVSLQSLTQLREVTIGAASTFIDPRETIKTETITARALQKAACCNLSESFETNASISVSFADAVTGAKQIQMLGLSGNYVQTNVENIPALRGLATTYGLQYVPGTWVSTIDVGKGAGSVVNGYESITGQLNVELQKPDARERVYLNAYVNSMGRAELNLNLAHPVGKANRWSTGTLLHTSRMGDEIRGQMDRNGDGFYDTPMFAQVNGVHRWKYASERIMAQVGVKGLYETRRGGQMAYWEGNHQPPTSADTAGHAPHGGVAPGTPYGIGNVTRRLEGFAKIARLYPRTPTRGLGLILAATHHDQRSFFGATRYDGTQNTLYANLIYQSILGTTNHAYKVGASYLLDQYRESYRTLARGDSLYRRSESVPGAFVEYTFTVPDKFTAVVGNRVDFHNLYGVIYTPRLHLKYNLSPQTTLRASVGNGFRVPNPLAENVGVLASSRRVVAPEALRPERAWNYGLNLTHDFRLGNQRGTLGVDLYRTDFANQLVVDMETPRQIAFYNLRGRSFANNVQVELNYQPRPRLDIKLAYKFYDVRTDYGLDPTAQRRLERQFVSRDRVLFNVAYATRWDKWKVDFTTQWNGRKRIPSLTDPASVGFSPAFFLFNAQVTRGFKRWDVYLGGENLGNFTQPNPIVAASQPFGPDFDASLVWAPIYGRMLYAGIRWKLP